MKLDVRSWGRGTDTRYADTLKRENGSKACNERTMSALVSQVTSVYLGTSGASEPEEIKCLYASITTSSSWPKSYDMRAKARHGLSRTEKRSPIKKDKPMKRQLWEKKGYDYGTHRRIGPGDGVRKRLAKQSKTWLTSLIFALHGFATYRELSAVHSSPRCYHPCSYPHSSLIIAALPPNPRRAHCSPVLPSSKSLRLRVNLRRWKARSTRCILGRAPVDCGLEVSCLELRSVTECFTVPALS